MQCWNIRELIKGNKKEGNIEGGLINDYLIIKELFSMEMDMLMHG